MPEKTQEERIDDAARSLFERRSGGWGRWGDLSEEQRDTWRVEAQLVLEAADAPRPSAWPSDVSVEALTSAINPEWSWYSPEGRRVALRAAMLEDPIIKAAVEYTRLAEVALAGSPLGGASHAAARLRTAVKKAGLL